MTRLIQLGDIHLCANPDAIIRGHSPQQRFDAAMRSIANETFDYLLLIGDVSDDGSVASYQRVIAACDALGIEWGWIPGNHDNPGVMNMLKPLLRHKHFDERVLLGLDSWVEGWDGGEVGATQLAQLRGHLHTTEQPLLLAIHHPPLDGLPAWMRTISLRDQHDLLAVLSESAIQPMVLSGHIHHAVDRTRDGIRVLTSPGCIDQFSLTQDDFHTENALPGFLRLTLKADHVHVEDIRFDIT